MQRTRLLDPHERFEKLVITYFPISLNFLPNVKAIIVS
jgi:hypothetical protein